MIIKITPDKSKAKSLISMARTTLARLKETEIEKYPSNSLTDYYDIIHKIMEAISTIDGIKTKGEGAHQELINYVCKRYDLEESNREFMQEMRDYRNRISYDGFNVNIDYINTNFKKIEGIINKLIGLVVLD